MICSGASIITVVDVTAVIHSSQFKQRLNINTKSGKKFSKKENENEILTVIESMKTIIIKLFLSVSR